MFMGEVAHVVAHVKGMGGDGPRTSPPVVVLHMWPWTLNSDEEEKSKCAGLAQEIGFAAVLGLLSC